MALRIVANNSGGGRPDGPMGEATDWAATWRSFWENRFDRLTDYLEQQKHKQHGMEEENDDRSKPSNDP